MDYTPQERKFLSRLGRTEDGRDLMNLLARLKSQYSSIDGIASGDYGAQVEGRKLFIQFADDLIEKMQSQERPLRPLAPEDYT